MNSFCDQPPENAAFVRVFDMLTDDFLNFIFDFYPKKITNSQKVESESKIDYWAIGIFILKSIVIDSKK